MKRLGACNDTYVRGPEGVWCYPWGAPVAGGRDLTLADLIAIEPGAELFELIERYRPLSPEERRWLRGERVSQDGLVVRVRRGSPYVGDLVVGLQAPELHPYALLTVGDIASEAGVSKATVDSYRYRGYLPQPQVMRGRTPLWARPIVAHWISTRPGCGWRSDVHSVAAGDGSPSAKDADDKVAS